MSSFSGTQTKCKACEKIVYLVDQLIADGLVYHRTCFRCHHCNSTLKVGSYASIEGVLYCKPHFEQLYKQTGSLQKSFDSAIKEEQAYVPPPETTVGELRIRSKPIIPGEKKTLSALQMKFSGTQDKCIACNKTVYPLEKVGIENLCYHKNCFKCIHGACRLSLSNYQAIEGKLYCKPHYTQLFTAKGNYSELQKKAVDGPDVAAPVVSAD